MLNGNPDMDAPTAKLRGQSLLISNYKCFRAENQILPTIKQINLIIGRNNSGKSTLLDVVRYSVEDFELSARKSESTNIWWCGKLQHSQVYGAVEEYMSSMSSQGILDSIDMRDWKTLVGSQFKQSLVDGKMIVVEGLCSATDDEDFLLELAHVVEPPMREMTYLHIAAERHIGPEIEQAINSHPAEATNLLRSNGEGATNLMRYCLTELPEESKIIENLLRTDLNEIMQPDAYYIGIGVHRQQDKWEIYLQEEDKDNIALSELGSGLQTVLLVLLNMKVVPHILHREPENCVFAFEELENSLHPGLQRRLYDYINKTLLQQKSTGFITTHSPVAIDHFSQMEHAQILHVNHTGEGAKIDLLRFQEDGFNILDDLDVRASDMLQANGVVWVEGISDKIYITKWIELYCIKHNVWKPTEGTDFVFLEYGGKCLSHLDYSISKDDKKVRDAEEWLIKALKVSRNVYVVMDSDLKKEDSKLGATKRKVIEAVGKGSNENSWVTKSREIENYLSDTIAEKYFGRALLSTESAGAVLMETRGTELVKRKAALLITKELKDDALRVLDLEAEIKKLLDAIKSWNNIEQ